MCSGENIHKYKLVNLPMEQPDDSLTSIRVLEWLQFGYGKYVGAGITWKEFNSIAFRSWPFPRVFSVFPPVTNSYTRHETKVVKICCSKILLLVSFQVFDFQGLLQLTNAAQSNMAFCIGSNYLSSLVSSITALCCISVLMHQLASNTD